MTQRNVLFPTGRRFGVLVLTGLLLVTSCGAAPTVPGAVQHRVRSLITAVRSQASVRFQGYSCDSQWVPRTRPYLWTGQARLGGDPQRLLPQLRHAAVRQGWQPYTLPGRPGWVLVHTAPEVLEPRPEQVSLAVWATPDSRAGGVRIDMFSDTSCSPDIGDSFQHTPTSVVTTVPAAWTPQQRRALAAGYAAGYAATRAIGDVVAGRWSDLPAEPDRNRADYRVQLSSCLTSDGRTGLAWSASTTLQWRAPGGQAQLPGFVETLRRTAGADWSVTVHRGAIDGTMDLAEITLSPAHAKPGAPHINLDVQTVGPELVAEGRLRTGCVAP